MSGFKKNSFTLRTPGGSNGNAEGIAGGILSALGLGDPGGRIAMEGQMMGARLANQYSLAQKLGLQSKDLGIDIADKETLRRLHPEDTARGQSIRNERSADTERGLSIRQKADADKIAREELNKVMIEVGGQNVPLGHLLDQGTPAGARALARISNDDSITAATEKALATLGVKRLKQGTLADTRGSAISSESSNRNENRDKLTNSNVDLNADRGYAAKARANSAVSLADSRVKLIDERALTQKEKTKQEEFLTKIQAVDNARDRKKVETQIAKLEQEISASLTRQGLDQQKTVKLTAEISDWANKLADDEAYRQAMGMGLDATKDIATIAKTKAIMALALERTKNLGQLKGVTGSQRLAGIVNLWRGSLDKDGKIELDDGTKIRLKNLDVAGQINYIANKVNAVIESDPALLRQAEAESHAGDVSDIMGVLGLGSADFGSGLENLEELQKQDIAVTPESAPQPPPVLPPAADQIAADAGFGTELGLNPPQAPAVAAVPGPAPATEPAQGADTSLANLSAIENMLGIARKEGASTPAALDTAGVVSNVLPPEVVQKAEAVGFDQKRVAIIQQLVVAGDVASLKAFAQTLDSQGKPARAGLIRELIKSISR